jgi:hypothetical protein
MAISNGRKEDGMVSTLRLSINNPEVISDTIDGEVVIVNLDKGYYYSLDGTGAEVWGLVQKGHSVAEIVQEMVRRYAGDRTDIEAGIARFISELEQEEILVPSGVSAVGAYGIGSPPGDRLLDRPFFQVPVLKKYVDMQEMLTLDPIHEVDETGWPNRKADPSE